MTARLLREPWRFGFHQGTRMLEWVAARRGSGGGPAGLEAVRFRASTSARFPADEVQEVHSLAPLPAQPGGSLDPATGTGREVRSAPFQMVVGFLGLTGPNGTLPTYFHRLIRNRLRAKDHVLRDFLDLFNHRAISLFHAAWVKYRFPIAFERVHRSAALERSRPVAAIEGPRVHEPSRPADPGPSLADDFSGALLALVGFGTGGLRGRHPHLEAAILEYAGLFARYPRSAIGLEQILSTHFRLPIRVFQFQGQWLTLEAEDRSRLGGFGGREGSNNGLGKSALLGSGVWDAQGRFRLRLGPLDSPSRFSKLLPTTSHDELERIQQLTRLYVGPSLQFDIQLVLPAGSSVPVELGGEEDHAPLLGWNVWLKADPFEAENGDAVFSDEFVGHASP